MKKIIICKRCGDLKQNRFYRDLCEMCEEIVEEKRREMKIDKWDKENLTD